MQATGSTGLTCPQWSNVTSADANCISTVQTAMLAVVSNPAVVPAPYQSMLTMQMNAMFSMPCPYFSLTLAGVNLTAFSASVLSAQLAYATSTTVVAQMSNYIVTSILSVNITRLLPSLAAAPTSAFTLVANMTSALAAALGVSPASLSLGAFNIAPMLNVSYNVSVGGTNATTAVGLVSSASGLGSSPVLTYALSQLGLQSATVAAAPTVFAAGKLQLMSLNSTLVTAAVNTVRLALLMSFPGSTLVSLASPPLDMPAAVQTALVSVRSQCICACLVEPALTSPSCRR